MIFLYILGAVIVGLIIAGVINQVSYIVSIPPRRAVGQSQESFDVTMSNFNNNVEKREARYNAMAARNERNAGSLRGKKIKVKSKFSTI